MTRSEILAAIESGKAFSLLTADGKEYDVPHRDYISLPPKGASVIVYRDDGFFHILSFLTMTGLRARSDVE